MLREELNKDQKLLMFKYRTRMAKCGENFRGPSSQVMCPLCTKHQDSQDKSYECPVIRQDVKVTGNYDDIYSDKVKLETVETITKIDEFKKEKKIDKQTERRARGKCQPWPM